MNAARLRCESYLRPREEVILQARAGGSRRPGNTLGAGHLFLTTERILWFARRPYWLFRVLRIGKWLPAVVEIDRTSIRSVQLKRYGALGTVLEIDDARFQYTLRLARDHFLLLSQSTTANRWCEELLRQCTGGAAGVHYP